MVTLSYDQIADLLIENKPALEDFLAVLAKASDKKCWLINYLIYKTYTRKTSDPLPP
ncbi:MAG: hypothetical protein KBD27_03400 [Candidatus Moranbacteria bacterium]|nr:hypothetical protein [Candidatus Moranbacteria bacterium]